MSDAGRGLAGPGIMLLSAALFGYFGFAMGWNHTSVVHGGFLLFVALLDWTLKGSAIAFGVSALVTMARPVIGNLLYGAAGLISALLLLVVAILDIADTQHTAVSPFLLFIFVAWNGWASISSLRDVLPHLKSPGGPGPGAEFERPEG